MCRGGARLEIPQFVCLNKRKIKTRANTKNHHLNIPGEIHTWVGNGRRSKRKLPASVR